MQIRWPLFFWIFRPLLWLTLFSSVTATGYVLLQDKPLDFRIDSYAPTFVLVHSFLISRLIGRVRSESFAFLYSQGFSRDVLWGHVWLATLASVLATWLPCSLLILTPVRALFQDAMQDSWFPLMASTEWPFLAWGLLLYAMVLSVFHHEWIRLSMPFRGLVSGHFLALSYFVFATLLSNRLWDHRTTAARYSLIGGIAIVSVILGVFGRWMHRRMEVIS
jgi:hypothetical protein